MTDEKKPPEPVATGVICAGVDVMSDRLEVGIYAFTPEASRVAALTLWCDPAQDAGWQQLHALLCSFSGLQVVAVDSGGLHTQQVYRFAHASRQEGTGAAYKVFASKTQSIRGGYCGSRTLLVDVTSHLGQVLPEPIELLLISIESNTAQDGVFALAHAAYLWRFAAAAPALAMRLKPPAHK